MDGVRGARGRAESLCPRGRGERGEVRATWSPSPRSRCGVTHPARPPRGAGSRRSAASPAAPRPAGTRAQRRGAHASPPPRPARTRRKGRGAGRGAGSPYLAGRRSPPRRPLSAAPGRGPREAAGRPLSRRCAPCALGLRPRAGPGLRCARGGERSAGAAERGLRREVGHSLPAGPAQGRGRRPRSRIRPSARPLTSGSRCRPHSAPRRAPGAARHRGARADGTGMGERAAASVPPKGRRGACTHFTRGLTSVTGARGAGGREGWQLEASPGQRPAKSRGVLSPSSPSR